MWSKPDNPEIPREPSRVEFANTLRGMAAFLVMVSHYLAFYGPEREQIAAMIQAPILTLEQQPIPAYSRLPSAIPGFSLPAFSVALFFLISGFVIPFSTQRLNGPGFCVNRLFRILPTYMAGFTFSLLLLYAGRRYFSRDWPYAGAEVFIHYFPGLRDVLWSRHIDFIVWTLEIEMKFYLLCALLIGGLRRCALKVFWTPVILFLSAQGLGHMMPSWERHAPALYRLAVTYYTASQYILFMFIGAIFHYMHRGRMIAAQAVPGIGAIFGLFCLQWATGPGAASRVVAWSYGVALLTFTFAYKVPGLFRSNRVFDFLANISYPLYVIHGVAGFVALRLLADRGIPPAVALMLVTGLCLIVSWLFHLLVERPSQQLGKKLGRALSGSSRSPAPTSP